MRPIRRIVKKLSCAVLTALLATACDSDGRGGGGGTPTGPDPVELRVGDSSGSNQQGEVATVLAAPLAVRVQDAAGRAAAGVAVAWAVTGGDGQLSAASATTDAEGRASVQWVLGRVAGTQTATATVSGLTPVSFTARALPGRTASLTLTPTPLVLARGGSAELRVIARDAFGNLITGRPITLRSAEPAVAGVTAGPAGSGAESTMATISGARAGTTVVTAESEGVTGSTAVSVMDDTTPVLTVGSGSGQTGTAGLLAPEPLVARVILPGGAGVAGRTVRFAVISGGGTLETATATTDANGSASTRFTFGPRTGLQVVSATVDGLTPISFTLTAVAGQAATVSAVPAVLTLHPGGAARLDVTATDVGGNAVPTPPMFTSANPAVATVTPQGVVLGVAAGATTVTVQVDGATTNVPVTVSGSPAPSVSTVTITPSPVGVRVGESVRLTIVARDAAGSMIPGLPVTLSTSNAGVASVSADGSVTGVAAGTAEVTATVGGVTARVTVTVSPAAATVGSVTVTPNPVAVAAGGSVPLSVVVRDPAGAVISGLPAAFTSSNPAVATVSAQGVVTGVATGSAIVTVTVNGVSTAVLVQVSAATPPVATVTISPSPVSLTVGGSVQLAVTARDASGNAIPGLPATLASTNPGIVRVNADGSITGVAPGTAEVTATVRGVTARVTVTVTAATPPVATVTISPSPVSLTVGGSVQLTVTARDASGNAISGLPATLTSTNPSIVRVNANGSITGVAPGTAEVTATVGGVTARATVTVTAAVATVTISPSPVSLTVGGSVQLAVTARDASGNAISGLPATLTSTNPSIVRVNANGSITGVAPGTAEVTATVGGVTARATVTVTAAVATVTISPSPVTLPVGGSVQLTVTARDASGNAIPGLPATLTSTNPGIVRVNANGSITGVAPGTAEVTATVGGVTARATVTVTPAVTTVTISPSPVTLPVGGSVQLTVTARDASGNAISGLPATLTSTNPSIVRVNANGSITGVAPGTAEVTATVGGVTARVNVTVTASVVTVVINPSPITLTVGVTLPITITALDGLGLPLLGLAATITSSNPSIVRVNANGTITGLVSGTAVVTATVLGVSAQVTVTVVAPPATVVISPSPLSLRVGATVPLTITSRDAAGGILAGLTATLTSSNPSVLRVNANGTVTGLVAGTAVVTATVLGVTAQVTVTVTAPEVATIEVTPATLTLRVGEAVRLNIAPRDALGELLAGLTSTLTSSNPLVALVAPDGTVTGLLPGTAEITVRVGSVSTRVAVRVTL